MLRFDPKTFVSVFCRVVTAAVGISGAAFLNGFRACGWEQPPAPIVLTLFAGGAGPRTKALRAELDDYERLHPGISVKFNTGGATSELQRQYLTTLLDAHDPGYDAFVIDIVNPAEYAAAGWLEPLEPYLPGKGVNALDSYLPAERSLCRIDGRIVALPWIADAQFLFYRTDLLQKYGLRAPQDWDELSVTARRILLAEKDPHLFGLSIQGAPIEGTVCTFLLPYWSQRKEFLSDGHLSLDRPAALAGFKLWRGLLDEGVLPPNTAEVRTGDTTNEFKAGNALFAINWGSAWAPAEYDADSQIRGRFGIARVPRVPGGISASSVGGWEWAVSAFSAHKATAADLIQYLTSRAAVKALILRIATFPAREDLYSDPDLHALIPWLGVAHDVFLSAKNRPITPRYGQVSDVLRTTTSAVLGGSTTPEAGVDEIETSLRRVLR